MKQQIDSIGLRIVLNDFWSRYQLPLFIVENGIGAKGQMVTAGNGNKAIMNDFCNKYMNEQLVKFREAIEDGIDVMGYTSWRWI